MLDLLNETLETEPATSEFGEFLDQHISVALSKGFADNVGRHAGPSVFVIPPASVWFDAAFKLYDYFSNSQGDEIKVWNTTAK